MTPDEIFEARAKAHEISAFEIGEALVLTAKEGPFRTLLDNGYAIEGKCFSSIGLESWEEWKNAVAEAGLSGCVVIYSIRKP